MKTKIHAIAGVIGFLTIATFWSSTLIVELFGSHQTITATKQYILWGMLLLIPSMMIAGASGMSLGKGRSDAGVLSKQKRMPIIAMNGLLVLVPCAFFLASKAAAGAFDTIFYTVQGIELLAGATNLTLMGLNIRDGLRLTGKLSSGGPNNAATIELRQNGPAIVSGVSACVGANGESIPLRSPAALCRCGASANKPFCDGSHTSSQFSDQKSDSRTTDEVLTYEGREMTVHYNRMLCSKAYECGSRLQAVFDTTRDPWIDPDKGSVDDVADVIRACPSGALSYQLPNTNVQHKVAAGSAIEIERNGPYRVRGISLRNEGWAKGACEDKYTLCRCGASKNKPFCDGSHVAAGFKADAS